ncbi:MAG: hypothetical protein ACRDKJ_08650 [Actinomycetota bacterium]
MDDRGHATEKKYEFVWGLGELVTALAEVGLALDRLEEFRCSPNVTSAGIAGRWTMLRGYRGCFC